MALKSRGPIPRCYEPLYGIRTLSPIRPLINSKPIEPLRPPSGALLQECQLLEIREGNLGRRGGRGFGV